jgi:hypothetical protein
VSAVSGLLRGTVVPSGWPRFLWFVGWWLFAGMAVHVAALAVTGGPVSGPVSLRKPASFAEAGWLIAWSVALILPLLRTRRWQRHVVGSVVVLFGVGETTVIGIQAWRGVPSHYNFSTPLDAALMRGGAAGTAAVFLVGMVVLLVAAVRTPRLQPSVRFGVLAGIGALLFGCLVGFVMVSNNSGVYQGVIGSGFGNRTAGYLGPDRATVGPEYLMLRPATRGGDLVLLHAIGIHGLVLLAVPAILLARTAVSRRRQLRVVAVSVAGVAVAAALLLVQALRQQPLDRLNPLALAVLAVCGVALVGSYVAVVGALFRRPPVGGQVRSGRSG